MEKEDLPQFKAGDLAQLVFSEQALLYALDPIKCNLLRVAEVSGRPAIHVCHGFFGNYAVYAQKYPLDLIDRIDVYKKQQYFFMF